MRPSWIIFDIGGVILDWHTCLSSVVNYLKIDSNIFTPVFQKYLPEMEKGSIASIDGFKKILTELKITNVNPAIINQIWIDNHHLITPTKNLIKKLAKNYPLGICTNNWLNYQDTIYKNFPVFDNFQFMIQSSVEKITKPNSKIYKLVENKCHASGNQIFFIDDSLENINGAKQLNWQTFLFDSKTNQGQESCDQLSKTLLDSK